MKLTVFTLLCLLSTLRIYAQTNQLEGSWQGILKQPKNNIVENYAYWLEFKVKGDSIVGFARTELANTPYFAIIKVAGIVSGNTITFTQQKIVKNNNGPDISYWCLINGVLKFDIADQSLAGKWTADDKECGIGSLLLYKSIKPLNMNNTLLGNYEELKTIETKLANKTKVVGAKVILKKIFFDVNSAAISSQSTLKELEETKSLLLKYPTLKVNVLGHTDQTGNDDINMRLSYLRAKAVYDYLIKNGINPSRITYEGYGKSRPLTTSDNQQEQQTNRRVEIQITAQ